MNNDPKSLLKGYNMLLYFAGSMIMYEPTEECILDFWKNGSLKKLPVSSSNPRFIQAASLLRESCDEKDICKRELADDYFRLFDPAGLPLAPAVKSYFIKNPDPLHFTGDVKEFYDSYGWRSKLLDKIPADHIGIELLFLTRLIDKFLLLDDDPCCCEMKKEIRRFIDDHVILWIPEWNKAVQEYSHTDAYKGIGNLVLACVEDIYGIMDQQNTIKKQETDLKN